MGEKQVMNYEGEGCAATLEVRPTNVLTECVKERLQGKYWASVYLDENGDQKAGVVVDETEFYIRYRILPALVCCTSGTISIQGAEVDWKDYEVFEALPPRLFLQWRDLVSTVNPHLFGISETLTLGEKEKKI